MRLGLIFGNGANGIEPNRENRQSAVKAIYTVDGTRLACPQRGLNILLLSDGSTRKIIIK